MDLKHTGKVKLGIDIDGVLCDPRILWNEYYSSPNGHNHSTLKMLPLQEQGWDYHKKICDVCFKDVLNKPEFLLKHEVVHDAHQILKSLAEFSELYVVTSRSDDNKTLTETWLKQKGLIYLFKGIFHTNDKTKLCESLGIKYLLDDNEEVLNRLEGSSVTGIVFDRPHNRSVHNTRVHNWKEFYYLMKAKVMFAEKEIVT